MSDKDIIYRQAAIEEWKNDFKGYVNALNIPRDDYNGICAESVDRKLVYKEMEYIDELPSAQPEIIRCKDCRWHNVEINQCNVQICASMYGEDFCSKAERRKDV